MTEREPYPSEKQDRFIVRLPDGMRDRIKAAASHNGRSMNAEIVHALTYWLEIDLPFDVELGAGTNASEVGRRDWEDARKDKELNYKSEISRSISLMQNLLRELNFGRPHLDADSKPQDSDDKD